MADFTPTPEQKLILAHDLQRHARVLAGPGTGKSATLVAYVEEVSQEAGQPNIKLLTFTRAATAELANKVAEHPEAASERPSTVHSFAISILLRNPGAADFPLPLRIADKWEQGEIVHRTLARRLQLTVRQVEKLFAELSANWQSLRDEHDPKIDPAMRARFQGGWQEHRQVFGYTLLGELPYALRTALRNYPELDGVDHDLLIIDEYQDLNACDLEVIRLISNRGTSVIATGDDDQSIYSFRKAAPEGIRKFLDDYPGSDDYSLSVSMRCGTQIIAWANHVIEGDPDRPTDKPPLTSIEGVPPGDVALLSFASEVQEAKGIASLAQTLVEQNDVPPSDILILLRSDHHGHFSRPIKRELDIVGIPYTDPDAVDRMLAERRNRRCLECFRLLANREDSVAWASLLGLTKGIGEGFIDYIYQRASALGGQFGGVLLQAREDNFPDGPTSSCRVACSMVDGIVHWLEAHAPPDQLEEGGWGRWIIQTADDHVVPKPSPDFQEVLMALDDAVEADDGLSQFLRQLFPLAKDQALAQSEGIRIMTMGGAKGLTVRATIVAALEDEVIPRPNADPAEERRLLYVAMTRAREFLFGTWARRRQGPTARAGRPNVATIRRHTRFLYGGPVESQNGTAYVSVAAE